MRNFSIIIILVSTILVAYGIIISSKSESDKVCDQIVIMNDGSTVTATNVTCYEGGMTTIEQCNGEEFSTPTVNIKMVKNIK